MVEVGLSITRHHCQPYTLPGSYYQWEGGGVRGGPKLFTPLLHHHHLFLLNFPSRAGAAQELQQGSPGLKGLKQVPLGYFHTTTHTTTTLTTTCRGGCGVQGGSRLQNLQQCSMFPWKWIGGVHKVSQLPHNHPTDLFQGKRGTGMRDQDEGGR